MTYVEVVFKTPLNKSFTYQCSFSNPLYKRALVSLGTKQKIGFIIRVAGETSYKGEIKPLVSLLDDVPLLDEKDLVLAKWISYYYHASLGESLSLFFSYGRAAVEALQKANASSLYSELNVQKTSDKQRTICLNSIQKTIATQILRSFGKYHMSLIHGVTGSGKTHIYLRLMEVVLQAGKQVLLLVPEISLTPQLKRRITEHFDPKKVTVLHSRLSNKERSHALYRIREGKTQILIGPRSSLFAPVRRLGLVILDEEHDSSYKNEMVPRYHARGVAQYKCQQHQALLVLGSATPSVEAYYQCEKKKIELHVLSSRYGDTSLPKVHIQPASTSHEKGSILPIETLRGLYETLAMGKQAMVYLNYRGYARTVYCSGCQRRYACERCSVSLTYHKARRLLICHQCGYREAYTGRCLECEGAVVENLGFGTEALVEEIENAIDIAKVMRFDSDNLTTSNKLKKAIDLFLQRKYNLIVGTQMIVKGHDFPGVQMVVIVCPESVLHLPDYRCQEKLFSQITQVAGRAGRRDTVGKVFLLTRMAGHNTIQYAKDQNYLDFYRAEINIRRVFGYPPFKKICRVVLRGPKQAEVERYSYLLEEPLKKDFRKVADVLGPAPCLLSRIKSSYRWSYLFKVFAVMPFIDLMKTFQDQTNTKGNLQKPPSIYLEYDMDPVDLF